MIKIATIGLLTAALAGLSATAKAEPVVYYCETKGFIRLMPDGEVMQYKPERFPMKIESNKVSFGGDGYLGGSEQKLQDYYPSTAFFTYVGVGEYAVFSDNLLRVTMHNYKKGYTTALVAKCEDF